MREKLHFIPLLLLATAFLNSPAAANADKVYFEGSAEQSLEIYLSQIDENPIEQNYLNAGLVAIETADINIAITTA